ncbi:VanZ family protein [Microbacterium sp. ASV49]|uniref:VanZ family protein n=1 Tax=Microbacterium candidum TaxID=3041922 RepID=A0ABT7MTK2_9MICO|nr:VanZ family protein [Microbacterium sp. ASV49]MDL9977782.1 VanZ family protein [Microbacterium sp. ASV49]
MERYGPVVAAAILVGIPAGIAVVWALARWRLRHGATRSWAWRASTAEVGLVLGTIPWVWMIMTPRPGVGGVSLVPFQDLMVTLRGDDAIVQVGGNLLVLAAVGFFLPIRFRLAAPKWVPAAVALIAAGISLLLEILQHVLQLGRVSSIDDVLVNTVGAVIACVASRHWWRSRDPHPQTAS